MQTLHTEEFIQRTVRAAIAGDIEALSTLSSLSCKRGDVLKQTLHVISYHLQHNHPTRSRGPFSEEETSAAFALASLRKVMRRSKDGRNALAEAIILARTEDIFRWMSHLFEVWVFDDKRAINEYGQDRRPEALYHLDFLIPEVFQTLYGIPGIALLMSHHASIGSLLAQIYIVANREKTGPHYYKEFRCALIDLEHSSTAATRGLEWDVSFFQTLERHCIAFAKGLIGRLQDCSSNPLGSEEQWALLSVLLESLVEWFKSHFHNTLLDACLEQDGFIQAITLIFIGAVDGAQKLVANPQPSLHHWKAVVLITHGAGLLAAGIQRGGTPLALIAIRQGLLSSFIKLRGIDGLARGLDKFITSGIQVVDIRVYLRCLMESLQPLVIHPALLIPSLDFSKVYAYTKTIAESPPSKLVGFDEALDALRYRTADEFTLYDGVFKDALIATSLGSNAYKFCDNTKCPFSRKISKLGRCISCLSGYYCSRSCQKVVWKNGHKQECRQISSRKGAFPPIMTIHDMEYFTKTTIPRASFYAKYLHHKEKVVSDQITEESIFTIDLTKGVPIGELDKRSEDSDVPGPVVQAMYPTCSKLEKTMLISLGGATSLVHSL